MSLVPLLLLLLFCAFAYRQSDVDESSLGVVSNVSKVYAVTCTTSFDDFRVAHLHGRLRRMGYEVVRLRCADAFQNASTPKWGLRLKHYAAFVEKIRSSDPDELVVFLDAYDMLVEGDAGEAAHRFALFNSPLVVSCVHYAWPLPEDCPSYSSVPPTRFYGSPCYFACAGALMGTVSHLQLLFAAGNYTSITDDQCWLYNTLITKFKPQTDWVLDTNGSLFLSYTSAWEAVKGSVVENGRHVLSNASSPWTPVDREARPTFIHLDSSHSTEQQMKDLLGCSSTAEGDSNCFYEQVHIRSGSLLWPVPEGMKESPYNLQLALAFFVVCAIAVGCTCRIWRKVEMDVP
eukprot:TRINITY_DN10665_c0_g2_i1.p1 TRINITY_DN10665_c0_g2~~TRINITY_DN10665_c0_g2_i1.p1  ORF type:complete len:362 (-),score=25.35 TRINITY_DN10665_c0_g2_i1:17-1054(-)